jgi:hypothetical protein
MRLPLAAISRRFPDGFAFQATRADRPVWLSNASAPEPETSPRHVETTALLRPLFDDVLALSSRVGKLWFRLPAGRWDDPDTDLLAVVRLLDAARADLASPEWNRFGTRLSDPAGTVRQVQPPALAALLDRAFGGHAYELLFDAHGDPPSAQERAEGRRTLLRLQEGLP